MLPVLMTIDEMGDVCVVSNKKKKNDARPGIAAIDHRSFVHEAVE